MTEEELIRSNWYQALYDKKLTGAKIDYSFSPQDLYVLCCLHEADIHRKAIENLLEDCGFYTECELMSKNNYYECRKSITEDMLEI